MIKNQKGFTLIELLVVVLIIGILAAMAMPQYFKAVERSRMTEAVTLLGNIAQAQQRKYLQINKYASDYRALDVAPKGACGTIYYTKGNVTTGAGGNGFGVTINGGAGVTFKQGKAVAKRYGGSATANLQYDYTLERYYANTGTSCEGTGENGQALCADFCGIEAPQAAACCSDGSTSITGSNCAEPSSND